MIFLIRIYGKCVIPAKADMISLKEIGMQEKEMASRTVMWFGIDMPEKYRTIQNKLEGFSSSILYESLIYKRTSYRNIQKELLEDDAQIMYLQDRKWKNY